MLKQGIWNYIFVNGEYRFLSGTDEKDISSLLNYGEEAESGGKILVNEDHFMIMTDFSPSLGLLSVEEDRDRLKTLLELEYKPLGVCAWDK